MEPLKPELNLKMFQYKLVPSKYDEIIIKSNHINTSILKKFIIHITDTIQLGQKVPIYIIVERQREKFALGRDESHFILIIKSKIIKKWHLHKNKSFRLFN